MSEKEEQKAAKSMLSQEFINAVIKEAEEGGEDSYDTTFKAEIVFAVRKLTEGSGGHLMVEILAQSAYPVEPVRKTKES